MTINRYIVEGAVSDRSPHLSRGWEWDVLVVPDSDLTNEQRSTLMSGMFRSQVREVIR